MGASFLDVLGAPEQLEYINRLIPLMTSCLSEIEAHLDHGEESGDLCDCLGSLGALKITAARLEWLCVVRKKLTISQL